MKILIATGIFYPEIGGPASYARLLCPKLSHSNSVVLLTYSAVFKERQDKLLPYKVVRVWKGTPKILRHLVYFFKIFFLARKSDTVFALNAVSAGLPALIAARILKKKFLVRIAGDYAWETAANKGKTFLLIDDFQKSKKTGKVGILHNLQARVCKKADIVIVPSEYLASLVAGWGISREKIKVIYNGVDFQAPEISHEEARKKIGIAGSVILSVGRFVPWKGFRMLIKIMPQLLQINQFFRLVIVGDGPEYKILQSMIKNLGLEKKIYLVGKKNKEELGLYIAAADIFILNTGYEGFSHQILEAMSAGIPVITTATGGNLEVIHQGENGFLVRYNDEFNLIEAIKTIWQTPELRERFIEEGKKTAAYFSPEKMIDETIATLTRY
ncbi:MAG: glycosyltransferase family 4 protein [Candidatus Yanofskybacteria bacterium]|nr:glycosyltransferase family 4 protein [Candidatus Yanofskybacteria bacterium]